jgi:hypothetical protein
MQTFENFCKEEYNRHAHRSTHPYLLWLNKYIEELEEGYKVIIEGTF